MTRRSRRAAVPDRLLPVVWLDGLVQPPLERTFTPAGGDGHEQPPDPPRPLARVRSHDECDAARQ